ncbi:hypothetical protein A8C56_16260 [Niabella ginsenosidivorans]|uniref:Cell division protein FtsQ n=2 Tax=Niabella ginsenosidivorans TaxID=1176587 RepID=A0A1A9I3Q9_9BACT|nr:hypothetical protein A8C56_16260 [Niabella ginsenosidivorans]
MWLGVGIGMFIVIAAAMRVQDDSVCAGYDINIKGAGGGGSLFTSEGQIVKLLKEATRGNIKGQRKSSFDLPRIEDLLEQSAWVYNAELYFDNKEMLRVNVTERKPLARVFTAGGRSFYIDEAGKQIPLSDKVTLEVPVFTGYPDNKIMKASDSSLLENMIAAASFINSDSFWAAQVSQIDIRSCGKDCWDMQMIPVVGNHRVDLGDGSEIASKFHRLYLFYDQVLKRTGFDKYKMVDVQYDGQVVGIKGAYTKLDSIQLRKNIEQLLQQSRQANDLIEVAHPMPGVMKMDIDTLADARELYTPPVNDDGLDTLDLMPVGVKQDPVPAGSASGEEAVKKEAEQKPAARPREVKKTEEKKNPEKRETNRSDRPASEKTSSKKAAVKKEAVKPAHTAAQKEKSRPAAKKKTELKKGTKTPASESAHATGTKVADRKKATTKKNTH